MTSRIFLVFSFLFFQLAVSSSSSSHPCNSLHGTGSYSYDVLSNNGPADWHRIHGNELCGSGDSQSPIDFPHYANVTDLWRGGPRPRMKHAMYTLHSKPNNWAVECREDDTCGYTDFNGEKFYVAGLHFHTPSEHTLNGKQYPLEAHLVHKSKDGNLAVVSTMFEYSDEEAYATKIYEKKPREHGVNHFLKFLWHRLFENKQQDVQVNMGSIVSGSAGMCVYNGSLTTPPCTQNVWFLMQLKVQKVSRQQVHEYAGSVGHPMYGNNRPVQDLNNRKNCRRCRCQDCTH